MSNDGWTYYPAEERPFDMSGRMPSEYASYFESLGDRIRREPNVTPSDIEDLGRDALIFDIEVLTSWNRGVRSFKASWLVTDTEDTYWPDDLLVIGGTGCGDYYCISSSGSFQGIQIYEHEIGEFVHCADDFDSFYESIMAHVRRRNASPEPTMAQQPGTGQPATRSVDESEGSDQPQPEAEGRSR